MSDALNYVAFGWYPYLAIAVFVIGNIIRFDREQYTWKTGSSQLLRRRQLMWGSNLFHVGILVIIAGHFIGLLTPIAVFDALGIGHNIKQAMAILIGGAAGVLCFFGLVLLLHRRLTDPRILRNSSFGDIAILVLLLAQLMLGLSTIPLSLNHMDGAEMLKFMNWAQGIITLQADAASYILSVHPVFKTHLILGLTIVLVFPFSRLVHALSAPIWYLGRQGYQVVRAARRSRPRLSVLP